jgi:hypothetical protein
VATSKHLLELLHEHRICPTRQGGEDNCTYDAGTSATVTQPVPPCLYTVLPSLVQLHVAFFLRTTASSTTSHEYDALIAWAVDATWGSSTPLARVSPDLHGGRCLVADRDLAPGEVILSVPLSKVFSSKVRKIPYLPPGP